MINRNGQAWIMIIIIGIFLFSLLIAVMLWGLPKYNVYSRQLAGEAALREAEYSRQISIVEAEAKKQSAEKLAEAEITRARGIAEANQIIGNSITPEYLKYKFIEGLNDGSTETIYVPTEANIPILEAGGNVQR